MKNKKTNIDLKKIVLIYGIALTSVILLNIYVSNDLDTYKITQEDFINHYLGPISNQEQLNAKYDLMSNIYNNNPKLLEDEIKYTEGIIDILNIEGN